MDCSKSLDKYFSNLHNYLIVSECISPNGNKYLLGFVSFLKKKTYAAVKKLIINAQWEVIRKGTSTAEVIEYCKHKGSPYTEYGNLPITSALCSGLGTKSINLTGKKRKRSIEDDKNEIFGRVLRCSTWEEAKAIYIKELPQDFALHGIEYEKNFKAMREKKDSSTIADSNSTFKKKKK